MIFCRQLHEPLHTRLEMEADLAVGILENDLDGLITEKIAKAALLARPGRDIETGGDSALLSCKVKRLEAKQMSACPDGMLVLVGNLEAQIIAHHPLPQVM